MIDVIIIGAGIIGLTCARELSRYNANILVIEKENDVCVGTTKANSAIVHAGFDALPGTKKAYFNVRGAAMFPALQRELGFPYIKNGAFVLSFDEEGKKGLQELYDRGIANGVANMEIISGDKAREIEPAISKEVTGALWAKDSGIIMPHTVAYAMAENAYANGVKFAFEEPVVKLEKLENSIRVTTPKNTYEAKVVINCAGLYADEMNNMLCERKYHITPRKGEYCLLDNEYEYLTHTTLFQLPTKMGKGILVAPTVHGNILVGPTATDILDKENKDTTYEGLKEAWEKGLLTVPTLPKGGIITQFAGLRAHIPEDDYVLGWTNVDGFYNCLGIESPGLASSPAIGAYVADEVSKKLNLSKNENFNGKRKFFKPMKLMNNEELKAAIKENPLYGKVVCRCCVVSEAEIRNAVRVQPGAKDLNGVKCRCGAGMGRCQMGFCNNRIMEILAEELHKPLSEITKKGNNSNIIVGRIKD